MQNMNRKAIASIVQIMIITTLSIASLLIVYSYVKDLSTDLGKSLSPTVDCINQQSKVLSACVNNEGKVEVNLFTGIGEEINKLDARINEELFSCDDSCQSCEIEKREGQNKIYFNQDEFNPSNLVVSINGCAPEQLQVSSC